MERPVKISVLKNRLDRLPYEPLQKFYEMYKVSSNPSKDILTHTRDRIVSLRWGLNGRRK